MGELLEEHAPMALLVWLLGTVLNMALGNESHIAVLLGLVYAMLYLIIAYVLRDEVLF